MTIRVVIADDQSLVRTGFSAILSHEPDIDVVARQATDARPWNRPACTAPTWY